MSQEETDGWVIVPEALEWAVAEAMVGYDNLIKNERDAHSRALLAYTVTKSKTWPGR